MCVASALSISLGSLHFFVLHSSNLTNSHLHFPVSTSNTRTQYTGEEKTQRDLRRLTFRNHAKRDTDPHKLVARIPRLTRCAWGYDKLVTNRSDSHTGTSTIPYEPHMLQRSESGLLTVPSARTFPPHPSIFSYPWSKLSPPMDPLPWVYRLGAGSEGSFGCCATTSNNYLPALHFILESIPFSKNALSFFFSNAIGVPETLAKKKELRPF